MTPAEVTTLIVCGVVLLLALLRMIVNGTVE